MTTPSSPAPDLSGEITRLEGVIQQGFKKVDDTLEVLKKGADSDPQMRQSIVSELVRQTLENETKQREKNQARKRRWRMALAGVVLAGSAAAWYEKDELEQRFGPQIKNSRIYPLVQKFQRAYQAFLTELPAEALSIDEKRKILRKSYEERLWKLYNIEGKDLAEFTKLEQEIQSANEPEFFDLIMRIQQIVRDRKGETKPVEKKPEPPVEKSPAEKPAPEKPVPDPSVNALQRKPEQTIPPSEKEPEKTSSEPSEKNPPGPVSEEKQKVNDLRRRAFLGERLNSQEIAQLFSDLEKEKMSWWEEHRFRTETRRRELREKTDAERMALNANITMQRTLYILTRPPNYSSEENQKKEAEWELMKRKFEASTDLGQKELELQIREEQVVLRKKIEERTQELRGWQMLSLQKK